MRTTLDLPDALFRRVKATAALKGMKLKDFVTALLDRGMREGAIIRDGEDRQSIEATDESFPVIRGACGPLMAKMDNKLIADLEMLGELARR
jgi:hypothetical protein